MLCAATTCTVVRSTSQDNGVGWYCIQPQESPGVFLLESLPALGVVKGDLVYTTQGGTPPVAYAPGGGPQDLVQGDSLDACLGACPPGMTCLPGTCAWDQLHELCWEGIQHGPVSKVRCALTYKPNCHTDTRQHQCKIVFTAA